ncbi:hypothetical protein KW797_02595 [Candidatus Parcubacteria bacterium]|nr:hypothetical protein [Candidatus Parcubacteria bacterium]
MPIDVRVEGLDEVVAAGQLAAISRKAFRRDVGVAVRDFALDAVARSKKDYLSGPRPERLGVVSGRLRSSITQDVKEEGEDLEASVGTNVVYGRGWELGFHGTVQVKAHLRVVSKVFGKASAQALISQVRAHTRQVDQDARPFLEPAMRDALPALEGGIRQAMEDLPLMGGPGAA